MALALIAWAALGLLVLMQTYVGMPSSFTLLEHQRGVLYRKGKPVRELGPGRHRVWVGIEKVLFLDTRPISVSFDNRAVTLSDGATAVYGFSGSAEVVDVQKALYSSGNFSEMPAFILLCCARSVLNGQSSVVVMARQASIVDQIMERARPRLSAVGFQLLTFRMTQLNMASPVAPAPTASKERIN
jgi:regulator of protease activity HflC (stomatin/prohibitin superfamily)